jgi:hypothetical protein
VYETKDDDWRRPFDPDRPTGASLTIGSVAKLADAAAEARQMFGKLDDTLADLARRLAKLEESPVAFVRRAAD